MPKLIDLIEEQLLILLEAEETSPEAEKELQDILGDSYPEFVAKLGQNITDPKFRAAIKSLADQNPIQTSDISAPVKNLKPTQNEIDVDKSLKFPLTNSASAEGLLKGGTVAIAGKKIVTGGGGEFIIDGHHRWSQAYVTNPEVKLAALDLSNIKNPMDGLKATQLGIAGDIGKVPTQSVQGSNLLTMGEAELKKYVIDTTTDEVLEVFKKYQKGDSKEAVANYIWNNVKEMQSNNQPVPGAPKRDIMPQTDTAPDWEADAAVPVAESIFPLWNKIK